MATIRARFTARRRGRRADRPAAARAARGGGQGAPVRRGIGVHRARRAGCRDGRVQPGLGRARRTCRPGPSWPNRAPGCAASDVTGRRRAGPDPHPDGLPGRGPAPAAPGGRCPATIAVPVPKRPYRPLAHRTGDPAVAAQDGHPGADREPSTRRSSRSAGRCGPRWPACPPRPGPRRRWSPAPAVPTRWRCAWARVDVHAGRCTPPSSTTGCRTARPSAPRPPSQLLTGLGAVAHAHPVEVDGPGGTGGRGPARPLRRAARRPPAPRLAGAARAHPRRPGRDRAARAGPRLRPALAGRHARLEPAVAAAAARGAARDHPGRLRGPGPAGVGRPAQRRPAVHPGPAAPRGAAAAGAGARPAGWPRRSPAPRPSCARTPRCWTRWPTRCWPSARDGAGAAGGAAGRRAPGGAPPGAARLAARRQAWTAVTDASCGRPTCSPLRVPTGRGVALPGGLELVRARGRLSLRPVRWSTASPLPREDGHRVRR